MIFLVTVQSINSVIWRYQTDKRIPRYDHTRLAELSIAPSADCPSAASRRVDDLINTPLYFFPSLLEVLYFILKILLQTSKAKQWLKSAKHIPKTQEAP